MSESRRQYAACEVGSSRGDSGGKEGTAPQESGQGGSAELPSDLVGTWAPVSGKLASETFEFRADGTGIYDGTNEFTWRSLAPGKVTFTWADGTESGSDFSVSGSTLQMVETEFRKR